MIFKKLEKKKLEKHKMLLLKMKEDIIVDIKKISSETRPDKDNANDVSGHALHMADVATDMYDREFNLGLASNDRELLFKIDEALKRIEEKNYGVCIECKKPIPSIRLKAIPYTDTCMKCQEKIESQRRP